MTTAEMRPKNPPMKAPRVGQPAPVDRQQQNREIAGGGDAEGEAHHEGDVLLLEYDAENDGEDAEADRGDLRHPHLLQLVDLAPAEDVGVKIMADGRRAGQRQPGDDGEDGGEGDGGDEAEEEIAADGVGEIDRGHVVGAALDPQDRPFDRRDGGVEELRVGRNQADGAEADDERQDIEIADEAGCEEAPSCARPGRSAR